MHCISKDNKELFNSHTNYNVIVYTQKCFGLTLSHFAVPVIFQVYVFRRKELVQEPF
jgi:hypothetical protein